MAQLSAEAACQLQRAERRLRDRELRRARLRQLSPQDAAKIAKEARPGAATRPSAPGRGYRRAAPP